MESPAAKVGRPEPRRNPPRGRSGVRGRPLWVNVLGILTIAFLSLVVALHLTGHGMSHHGGQFGMHP